MDFAELLFYHCAEFRPLIVGDTLSFNSSESGSELKLELEIDSDRNSEVVIGLQLSSIF